MKQQKIYFRNMAKEQQKLAVYQAENGAIELSVDEQKETLWASLQQIANVFGVDKSGVSRHIKNIFASGELRETSTVAKIATVQKEGKRTVAREIECFNLDVILSVGYRVNSKQATKFRVWATKTLREHIVNGYTIKNNISRRIKQNFCKRLRISSFIQSDIHDCYDSIGNTSLYHFGWENETPSQFGR